MLAVNGISCGYNGIRVLSNVSLDVAAGEIVGIIGPNGAGKSTLAKSILGYVPLEEGTISLGSSVISGKPVETVIRAGIGYVAQAGGVFQKMTVAENLRLGAYTVPSKAEVRERLDEVYEELPILAERRHQMAGTMSGGQQRLLSVARALMTRPKVVILDEPSAALSPAAIELTYDMLRTVNEAGRSLLIVEQNVQQIINFADRTYVLDIGRNAFSGTRDELMSSDRIRKLYIGNVDA